MVIQDLLGHRPRLVLVVVEVEPVEHPDRDGGGDVETHPVTESTRMFPQFLREAGVPADPGPEEGSELVPLPHRAPHLVEVLCALAADDASPPETRFRQ